MPRPVVADDLFHVRWLDTPRLSPDGARVAYVEWRLDRALDRLVSAVIVQPLDGGDPMRLTPDGVSDTQPRWSPDGRALAVVREDEAGRRVWAIPVPATTGDGPAPALEEEREGAEAQRRDEEEGISSSRRVHPRSISLPHADDPAWSPDGSALAVVGGEAGQRRIWRVPLDGGDAALLTDAALDATCSRWSPDGRRLAFLSSGDGYLTADVWVMDVADGERREMSRLYGGQGPIRSLAWSPDGRRLAFIGHERGTAQGANQGVWVVSVETRHVASLPRVASLPIGDRCAGLTVRADDARPTAPPDLHWATVDGQPAVLFVFADRGRSHLGRVSLDGGVSVVVGGERAVLAFDAAPDGPLAFVASDPLSPGEVYLADGDGGSERQVSHANDLWLAEVRLSRPQYLPVRAHDGLTVDAWLVRPSDVPPAARLPLVLEIHGGPHYALGERFYLEFQRLAAQGYAVLYANPRGSQGYGEAFATANRAAWGADDARDILAALDAALARGGVDPDRLAVTGVSYGGYMTQWLVAHSDRFRAAISENGISDLVTAYHTSHGGQPFWAWEMDGTPDTAPDRYRALSPLTHATRIHTPLLLIHAEGDTNCPIGQSEAMLAALQSLGRVVALERIPDEGHLMNLIGRPSRRLQRTAALDGWLARYLAPGESHG